jgi:hypothetical protein
MKKNQLKKFQKTLTICLIANCLFSETLKAEDQISPEVKILSNKVSLSLPLNPSNSERQKYIVNTSPENGYICHNFFREREIKDKLFELKTTSELNKELENKLLTKPSESYFINPSTTTSVLVGSILGIVGGFFLFNKK